jgi:hypothetical protein
MLVVGIASGQWQPLLRLTDNEGVSQTSSNNARSVAAVDDVVHVVWYDYRDGNAELYYKRSVDAGATWTPDIRLTTSQGHSLGPSVAAIDSFVHVVWVEPGPWCPMVCYKRSSDRGGDWSIDTKLASDLGAAVRPCIALSDSFVHVVWTEFRSGQMPGIYYRRSTNRGTSWGGAARMSADTGASSSPSIAAWGANLHLVWVDNRSGKPELYYRRSTNNGSTWPGERRLTYVPHGSYNPCIAAYGSYIHVVWEYAGTPYSEIFHKCSPDNGNGWRIEERLSDTECHAHDPSVVAWGENVHAVWEGYREGHFDIYYRRSPDRTRTWEPTERLIADTARSDDVSVALAGALVHVVWTDEQDGNPEVYYRRNPTGNPGVEEKQAVLGRQFRATVVRGVLRCQPTAGSSLRAVALLDIPGRHVMDLEPGQNDIRHVGPGVYFMRPADSGDRSAVTKVVIQR